MLHNFLLIGQMVRRNGISGDNAAMLLEPGLLLLALWRNFRG